MDSPRVSNVNHKNSNSSAHNSSNSNPDRSSRSALDLRIGKHKLQPGVSNELRISESELYEKSRICTGGGESTTSGGAGGSRVNLSRKRSRMRIEGINRTRNLKKSIKIMVIIIALFLFSWLPIHLYRLTTTFYPILVDLFDSMFGNGGLAASRVINFRVSHWVWLYPRIESTQLSQLNPPPKKNKKRFQKNLLSFK